VNCVVVVIEKKLEKRNQRNEGSRIVPGSGMVRNNSYQQDSVSVFLCLERHKTVSVILGTTQ
jgi:hypothetical protein